MTDFPETDHFDEADRPAIALPGRKNSLMPSATGIRRAAMDWLARREHARCEIEQKLQRRFPDATAAIGPVLDELEHEGLLSTSRFIDSFTRGRIQRGYGPLRIAADLRQRGVTQKSQTRAEIVVPATATAGHDDTEAPDDMNSTLLIAEATDWLARARDVRARRFGDALPSGPVERNRQMAFLQRRGFSADICRQACFPARDLD